MGRVYSTSEIVSGLVVATPNHRQAARFMLDAMFNDGVCNYTLSDGQPMFEGAMVYGSAIDGPGPNLRSDVDILIICPDGPISENEAKRTVADLADKTTYLYKVSVEPQVHTTNLETERIDPLYAQHIVDMGRQHPEWTVNNPSKEFVKHLLLPDDWKGRSYHAAGYLYGKAAYFETAINNYGGFASCAVSQRAQEVPSSIGRKVLPATTAPNEILPPISDKQAMRQLMEERIVTYFDGYEAEEILDHQRTLTAYDSYYSKLLVSTLAARGTPYFKLAVKYHEEWIESHYLEACERAEKLTRAWAILIEDTIGKLVTDGSLDFDRLDRCQYYSNDDYC